MSELFPVPVPFSNVNDESVVVLEWLVTDGAYVNAGDLIVAVETSKAAVEVEAPKSGYVRQAVARGKEIPVGAILCYLADQADAPLPARAPLFSPAASVRPAVSASKAPSHAPLLTAPDVTSSPNADRAIRISPMARKLIEEHGIDPRQFAGHGLVRQQDVRDYLTTADGADHAPPSTWESTRFSASAQTLIAQHQLDAKLFDGRGLVRASDVLETLEAAPRQLPLGAAEESPTASAFTSPQSVVLVAGVPVRSESLPRRKRMEIKNLAAGFANTLTSTIVVACPTRGLRAAAAQQTALQGNVTAILLFEAAHLLREFSAFNACYAEDLAHYYQEINIGFAVDAGYGLKVPVVRNADRKSLTQIAAEMQELLVLYLNDQLPVESLAGGTFTITDLSGEGVFAFTPLISAGQSAILGVGSEFFAPGSAEGMFNLALAFDHQIGEGRLAARFLGELRRRVQAYEQALAAPTAESLPDLYCSRCLRTIQDLQRMPAYLLPAMQANGTTRLICTICLEGC